MGREALVRMHAVKLLSDRCDLGKVNGLRADIGARGDVPVAVVDEQGERHRQSIVPAARCERGL